MALPEEREAADRAYQNALMLAKLEHDSLMPELNNLVGRVNSLKTVIRGTSNLLGLSIDEKYRFKPTIQTHGGRP